MQATLLQDFQHFGTYLKGVDYVLHQRLLSNWNIRRPISQGIGGGCVAGLRRRSRQSLPPVLSALFQTAYSTTRLLQLRTGRSRL